MLKKIKENGWQWPMLVVAILGTSVIVNIAVVIRASADPSFVIEKNYYEDALNWDMSQEAKRKSAALGWNLDAKAAIPSGSQDKLALEVSLVDASGKPIENAQIYVKAFAVARSGDMVTGKVPPSGTAYRAELDKATRPGLWQLDFRVQRGGDVFVQRIRTDVYVR